MQGRDRDIKDFQLKMMDWTHPFILAFSQNSNEMTLKGFLTHNNKENGRRDNHNGIWEAEKKNLMAAVRKAKNKIVAHKHPQKEAPSTSWTKDETGLE